MCVCGSEDLSKIITVITRSRYDHRVVTLPIIHVKRELSNEQYRPGECGIEYGHAKKRNFSSGDFNLSQTS